MYHHFLKIAKEVKRGYFYELPLYVNCTRCLACISEKERNLIIILAKWMIRYVISDVIYLWYQCPPGPYSSRPQVDQPGMGAQPLPLDRLETGCHGNSLSSGVRRQVRKAVKDFRLC